MKTHSTTILIFLLLVICMNNLLAQSDSLLPYPAKNLIYPSISTEVYKEANGYAFHYSVGNREGAVQSIYRFMVETRAVSTIILSPQDWEGRNLNYDTIKVAKWASEDSASDIEANRVLDGFGLESPGLPSINRCWFRAWETVKGEEGQYDPSTAGIFTTSLQKSALGPADPPSPFVPLVFLDTLISYKYQCVALGWIDNQGIANSLDSKLDSAKSKLAAGDTIAAKNMLNAFVNEVEAQNGKHLSSEAYALLKFNAEYLIQQLG
jgi:hypothetical protein